MAKKTKSKRKKKTTYEWMKKEFKKQSTDLLMHQSMIDTNMMLSNLPIDEVLTTMVTPSDRKQAKQLLEEAKQHIKESG